MSDPLVDLKARVAQALQETCLADFSDKATPLLRDLLAYATEQHGRAVHAWSEVDHKEGHLVDYRELLAAAEAELSTLRTRAAQAEQADAVVRAFLKMLEQRGSISGIPPRPPTPRRHPNEAL